ncbi:unnamed protein product [Zymoseptoria tritici ST99CH_1E4]|uniref:Uncharacterized protein n=1 Tax=Zymoseptoria tritici ST99CH_1E4 TaxID=1276532 RepID=A0A2H1GQ51_ZYMTR|nr:unnamed protein product [Zymoseptoria tritici ST99CH_1E4]
MQTKRCRWNISSNNIITFSYLPASTHRTAPIEQHRLYQHPHRHTITSSPSNRSNLINFLRRIPPTPLLLSSSPPLSTKPSTNQPTNHITMTSRDILGNERFGRRGNREQYVLDAAWALYMMSRRDIGEAKEQMEEREREKREREKQGKGEEGGGEGEVGCWSGWQWFE